MKRFFEKIQLKLKMIYNICNNGNVNWIYVIKDVNSVVNALYKDMKYFPLVPENGRRVSYIVVKNDYTGTEYLRGVYQNGYLYSNGNAYGMVYDTISDMSNYKNKFWMYDDNNIKEV